MQDPRYFSLRLATNIGNISRRQAITWARDGILVPSKLYAHDERPYIFFYSFADLVALRVIWILRHKCGLSLQAALPAADFIRANAEAKPENLKFWVSDKRVFLAEPESESATLIELAPIVAAVKSDVDKLWYRSSDDYGKVEYRRDVLGGTLVVKGTRISVATVVNMAADGASEKEILHAYPSLVPEDIRGVLEHVTEPRRVA